MITLDRLLASRDARHEMQMRMLADNPDKTLVCMTVVMPGSVKRNEVSLTVAHAAVEALKVAFAKEADAMVERDLDTGYEAFLTVDMPLMQVKRMTCDIEDTHPLGRLFDIDVIDAEGVPVSRDRAGRSARRCLLCHMDARYCMRTRQHSQQEIWQRIEQMVAGWRRDGHDATGSDDNGRG